MCAVAWWHVTLVTADEGSTGCVRDGKMTAMPGEKFQLQSGRALLFVQILHNSSLEILNWECQNVVDAFYMLLSH